MESVICYKHRLIRGESFQLAQSDSWIPRYTLVREDLDKRQSGGFLRYRDRLDKAFWTKKEADEFALKEAMQWIDRS